MAEVIAELVNQLSNYRTVNDATRKLIEIGSDAVVPLTTILEDKTNSILSRVYAAMAIGRIGDKKAAPALIDILDDRTDYWEVRRRVAGALGDINDLSAKQVLLKAVMDEKSADVRGFAAEALGKLKVKAAIPALISLLNDPDLIDDFTPVAYIAVNAIGQIGGRRSESVLIELINAWVPCRSADDASVFSSKLMGSPPKYRSDSICAMAAKQLADSGSPDLIPVLQKLHEKAASGTVKEALGQSIACLIGP